LPGSPEYTSTGLIFGGLAILVTFVTVDPLALRPQLSPGLPLSDIYFQLIINGFACFLPVSYEISALRACKFRKTPPINFWKKRTFL